MNLTKLILSIINKHETIEGVLKSGDATYKVDKAKIVQDRKSINGINFYNNENVVYELAIDDINNLYTTLDYVGKTDEIPYINRVTFKINNEQVIDLYAAIDCTVENYEEKLKSEYLYKNVINGGIC